MSADIKLSKEMTGTNMIRQVLEKKLSYNLTEILGRGSYGSFVFKGEFGEKKKKVAVKRLHWNYIKSDSIGGFRTAFISSNLKHSNILPYLAIEEGLDFLFIVTERCVGTLQHWVNGSYKGPLIGDIDHQVLFQITSGLTYLHSSKIVHRDIKPSNILIFCPSSEAADMRDNGKAIFKLADFGIVSTLITDDRDLKKKDYMDPHGTCGWIPPELYNLNTDYDSKVDIFALGLVFGYILSGGKHLFGDSPLEQTIRIMNKKPMTLVLVHLKKPFCNDEQLFELIKSMVKMEPKDRPSSDAVLEFFLRRDIGMANEKMTEVVGQLRYDPKIIGYGFCSTVHSGFYSQSNTPVAVKRIEKGCVKEDDVQKEVNLMKKAHNHSNLLKYICCEMDTQFLYIATELCIGTLEDYVKGNYNGPKFESEKVILHQITYGLAHLHEKKIVHRDIKPTNILIFVPESDCLNPVIKVADFGISKLLGPGKEDYTNTRVTNPNGTIGWMAPEVYEIDRFDLKVDIFALGLIFGFTLSGGKHPFGDNLHDRVWGIKNDKIKMTRNELKNPYSENDQAFHLIKSMLVKIPEKRPTVQDILNSLFFPANRQKLFESICSSFKNKSIAYSIAHFKKLLIDENLTDVNIKLKSGYTLLHILCEYYEEDNLIDLVRLLIEKGVKLHIKHHGMTPLHKLLSYYRNDKLKDIVEILIERGAKVNTKDLIKWMDSTSFLVLELQTR